MRRSRNVAPCLGPALRCLAVVTSNDYDVTMSTVRIADLKSRLSEHLRSVRNGRSLTILDRDTPIARIVPWRQDDAFLLLRLPRPEAPKLPQVPLPSPLRLQGDLVQPLMAEPDGRR